MCERFDERKCLHYLTDWLHKSVIRKTTLCVEKKKPSLLPSPSSSHTVTVCPWTTRLLCVGEGRKKRSENQSASLFPLTGNVNVRVFAYTACYSEVLPVEDPFRDATVCATDSVQCIVKAKEEKEEPFQEEAVRDRWIFVVVVPFSLLLFFSGKKGNCVFLEGRLIICNEVAHETWNMKHSFLSSHHHHTLSTVNGSVIHGKCVFVSVASIVFVDGWVWIYNFFLFFSIGQHLMCWHSCVVCCLFSECFLCVWNQNRVKGRREGGGNEETQSDQLHSLVLTLFVKNGETQGKWLEKIKEKKINEYDLVQVCCIDNICVLCVCVRCSSGGVWVVC